MTHKNTLQTVLRFIAVTGIALGVIYLYAILHEGGHALFVLVFGGELTEFEINFLVSKPHISYTGINDPLRQALVSLGGPLVPLALVPLLILVLRRAKHVLTKGLVLLTLVGLLPTVLISAVIAFAYGFEMAGTSEDIARFLNLTGFNPFLTAGALVALFGVLLALVIKVGKAYDAAVTVVKALRENSAKSRTSPAAWVLSAILITAAVVLIGNAVRQKPVSQPLTYHTKIEVSLDEIDSSSTIFHTFKVDRPTVFDFVYSVQTNSEVTLQIVNLEGKPLLFGSKDTMTMYQGRESLSMARFTGFTLMPGEYGLEMSPGGSGLLTMYIDSREPSPIEHQYFHLLEMVNAGTFTADSYQEEGYELVFWGELSPGTNQALAAVPGGTELFVSAFAVGEGDVSLFYLADDMIHPIMQGFRATIGRGLPSHRSRGEFRASVHEEPVTLYVYVKRESDTR
ncbi:MAG: M50 family metallopeptidase [Limnochordia bacterium]|mgnify:CR=1 FL=1|nr:hypothetical protein [Bacillota bacterium]HXK97377.1 hypothetical protein [Limnochordia bacterium]